MRNVLNELAKNPKAMKIFQAIQRDPQLLNQVQSLGLLLQQKGYIDPSQPTKQPGPIIMMRMVADSDIRSKMMEVGKFNHKWIPSQRHRIPTSDTSKAKLLKDAGALDTNGKPVDMSNVFELMMGSSSPPPEIKGTIGDGKGKDQQEKTTDEGLTGKIKSIFRK